MRCADSNCNSWASSGDRTVICRRASPEVRARTGIVIRLVPGLRTAGRTSPSGNSSRPSLCTTRTTWASVGRSLWIVNGISARRLVSRTLWSDGVVKARRTSLTDAYTEFR